MLEEYSKFKGLPFIASMHSVRWLVPIVPRTQLLGKEVTILQCFYIQVFHKSDKKEHFAPAYILNWHPYKPGTNTRDPNKYYYMWGSKNERTDLKPGTKATVSKVPVVFKFAFTNIKEPPPAPPEEKKKEEKEDENTNIQRT